jgi:hypothetical protein
MLEDRLAPASFSEAVPGVIIVALTASNETITISANAASNYTIATNAPNTFSGAVSGTDATFSGFGASSGTLLTNLTGAGSTTQINIVDGTFTGGHVIFNPSAPTASYTENISISFTNANAGNIDFFGASTFHNSLSVATTKGTITVNPGATVTLNGGTTTSSSLQQTASGGHIAIAGTIVTTASETAFTVSAYGSNVPPGIDEASTGVIDTNLATAVIFQLNGHAGTINLDGGPNDFAGNVVIAQFGGGSVTTLDFRNTDPNAGLPNISALGALSKYTLVTDNASIPLANGPNLPTGITFNYTAGGDITESAQLNFGTATFTVLGNNSILLNSIPVGNLIPNVGFNAPKGDNTTQVSYIGGNTVTLLASNLGLGTFNVTALGAGDITQTGPFTESIGAAGNTFTLSPAGNGTFITLANAGNDLEGPITFAGPTALATISLLNGSLLPQFPSLPSSVNTLTLNYPNAPISLPNLGSVITTLTVTAQGVFQQPGTTLILNTPTSAATFSAGNNPIVLGNANDFSSTTNFGIQLTNSGPNQVVVNDINALNFGVGNTQLGDGTLTVTAGGAITQSSRIRQSVNAGQTSFTAATGNSITLNNAQNQLVGIVDLSTTGAGNASVTTAGNLNLGTSVIGTAGGSGTLAVTAGGNVTQDPGTTLTVAASSNFNGNNITLDNNGNVFHGTPGPAPDLTHFVIVNGNNVTLRASGGPINLGTSPITGSLIVRAAGAITQNGPITGATSSLFDAGTGPITLTDANNDLSGVTSANSNAAGLSFTGNTTSGSAIISGVSSVAGLSIGQTVSGSGIPAGATIIALAPTSITLSASATVTATAVPLTATAVVQLTAKAALQIGRINLGTGPGIGANALVLIAGGNITEAGGATSGITEAPLSGAAAFTMQQGRLDAIFTGNTTSGSPTVASVSLLAHLFVGQTIAGPGIPAGATITAIGASSITLSQNATATANGVTLSAGLSESQALAFTATTGTFALVYNGHLTAPLPATATASAVQTALQSLTGIGSGNVAVTGTPGNYVVKFQGALANTNVAPIGLVRGGNISINTNGSVSLNNANNNWTGLVDLTPSSVNGLTLTNSGSLNFLGAPSLAGTISLTAGQNITLPSTSYSVRGFAASAKETYVTQNLSTTNSGISFTGVANLGVSGTALTLTSAAGISFAGNVNVGTTTGGLTLAAANGQSVTLSQGTWSEGSSPLNITGNGVALNIGVLNGNNPATFNMIGGTIGMAGGGNVTVNRFGTLQIGDSNTTTTVDTVTLNNAGGNLTFNAGATLSVGLGTTNDQLVDTAGNVTINAPVRLTAYSGVAGSAASPVLTATAGTVGGFFAMTVDPVNNNAPHVFLMGTDIVVPTYALNAVSIVKGGTVSATGTLSAWESDSDKYTITASTGAAAQLTTATDVNGLLDVVVRNAPAALTLTIATTVNLGDGLTQLGGIAVDGPGAVTIVAANTDINLGSVDPFADVLVQGPLTGLTLRDFTGATANFQDFIRAGGTNAQSTTIVGRRFDSVSICLPSTLKLLSLADYNNTVGIDTVTAESFGTIATTGIANTFVLGDFSVSRLTNRNTLDAATPGLTTLSIAHQLSGQFDIQKGVGTVTAQLASGLSLGLPGGANSPNGDLMGNVTTLNLGIVTNSNLESIGTVAATTVTSWSYVGSGTNTLKASSFGTITATGNLALPAPADFGNFSNIALTATGYAGGAGLGTLSVAGDASTDTFTICNGNVTAITVARQLLSSTLNAGVTTPLGVLVTAANSTVGSITAGLISSFTLNARLLTAISAIGNATAGLFGDISGATLTLLGMPSGAPVYTGVALGSLKTTRNLQSSTVTVVDGSLTSVSVGRSITTSSIVLLNKAGTLGTLTAAEWIHSGSGADTLTAASIGTIAITGYPLTLPSSPLIIGDMQRVNILAFVNTGTTLGIGTLSIHANDVFASNGYLRSDNGIGTFTVGRDLTANATNTTNLISVRNPTTGKIATMTVGRWNNATASVDLVADTIGTLSVPGYVAPELPSKVAGDFLATNFVLLNNTKVDVTSITVTDTLNVGNLLAPGGIGTLTVTNELLGRVDTDNPKSTLGSIGVLQAGQIGDAGTSPATAIPATLRAESIGTLKTLINIPLGADGSIDGSTVTTTSTVPSTGIGTVSIASFITSDLAGDTSTFDVPGTISTFTVIEDLRSGTQIAAGFATGASLKTFTAGAIANSVLTARSIATLSVIGKSPTVHNAAVVTANVTGSIVTALGNSSVSTPLGTTTAGVGLGTVSIRQKVVDSDFNVAGGNVTSFTVGGMFGSHLTVGAHPAAYGNIVATTSATNWNAPPTGVTFKLGSFKTTGLFDPTDVLDTANFRDSFILAQQLGTVVITGLDTNVPRATATSGGSATATFGVGFRGSVGAGPKITVSFSNAGVLATQTLTAPSSPASPPVSTTPVSAFKYVNLAG